MNIIKTYVSKFLIGAAVLMAAFLSSCSNNDYVKNIPNNCTALLSVDAKRVEGVDGSGLLKKILQVEDVLSVGIDFKEKVYLFETVDGNIGLAAKIKNESDFTKNIDALVNSGVCTRPTKKANISFVMIKNSWLVAYNSDALMMVGPITVAARPSVENFAIACFRQEEEQSVMASKLYQRLDTIDAPIALVCQAQALPEKLVAPFTIGAPKEADASQVMIAAKISVMNKILLIDGKTYSENADIDKALKESQEKLRPITPTLVKAFNEEQLLGMFMNVNGKDFLPMLHQNKYIQALLVGLNTAIDMDNIIRSIDGDMAIMVPSYKETSLSMSLNAKLGDSKWLSDVDYWKQSCPKGSSIADAGKDTYCYTDGSMKFFFGVTPQLYFFSGNDEVIARKSLEASVKPLPANVESFIIGRRMAVVFNLQTLLSSNDGLETLLAPVFGTVNRVVYVN